MTRERDVDHVLGNHTEGVNAITQPAPLRHLDTLEKAISKKLQTDISTFKGGGTFHKGKFNARVCLRNSAR
jgi:hypothetical protein